MKKRIIAMVALVLVAGIVVGGLLMLFSSRSATAENIVAMGSGLSARLIETDETDDWKEGDGSDYTLDYGAMQPGDDITKKPKVERRDANPASACDAYVKVKVELEIYDGPQQVDYAYLADMVTSEGHTTHTFSEGDVRDLFEALMAGIYYDDGIDPLTIPSLHPSWRFFRDAGDPTVGWFYYVDGAGTLKVLPPLDGGGQPAATEVIFSNIRFPLDTLTARQLELYAALGLADVQIVLRLTAYLAQSDNNPYIFINPANKSTQAGYSVAFNAPALIP
ncbi:MAG: hypothetical protein FWE59_04410 [Oscillospiraceae bacterium]|nr:hypothetical protein [Oscillospiraceae bacterium]